MKAPSFAYAKPASLAEALKLLERPGAKILAGGQSLIPSLNMRLSSPEVLVDITALPGLSGISVQGNCVKIGALTTHAQIEKSEEIKHHVPLLSQAVPHIAHPAIRNRGTMGGSLALADIESIRIDAAARKRKVGDRYRRFGRWLRGRRG